MAFAITISTNLGILTIPQKISTGIELNGRQSKVILTDYSFGGSKSSTIGSRNKLLYSTAPVLFSGIIGDTEVVFLYGDLNQGHEFAFYSTDNTKDVKIATFSPENFKGGLQVVSAPNQGAKSGSSSPLILFGDTQTATTFFAPPVSAHAPSSDVAKKFPTYFQFGTNSTILVGGPYLVRNASISADGRDVALNGDLNATAPLTLVVPDSVRTVSWNGKVVSVRPLSGASVPRDIAGVTILQGELVFGERGGHGIKVPQLGDWKFRDSLPEIGLDFDDSEWIIANHTTTSIPGPRFGDGRVLYGTHVPFAPKWCK